MSKPLNDNIRYVSIEDDAGDLRPLLDEAGDKLSELVRAVSAPGRLRGSGAQRMNSAAPIGVGWIGA